MSATSAGQEPEQHLIHVEDVEVEIEHHPEDWLAFALFWALAFIVFLQFFTRYILNDSLADAMKAAALAGIKVWVMIAPRGGEGQLAYRAGMTYARELAEAGVRVLLYKGAYFHAKTVCVDSKVCSVGSANMDIRSFSINYETNLVVYDEAVTRQIEEDFRRDIDSCVDFSTSIYDAQPLRTRLLDSVMRLGSPLL